MWSMLAPSFATAVAKGRAPVMLSCTEPTAKIGRRPAVIVIVRPALIEGLSWWQPGAAVAVKLGAGEHAGMMRIEPSPTGQHRIVRSGGQFGDVAPMLRLYALPRMPSERHPPTAVDFEWHDRWLEITLPDWARQPEPALRLADVGIDAAAAGRKGCAPVPGWETSEDRKAWGGRR